MPFPHPVRSFAGRRAELDRMRAHAGSDVLFFVYGLAGAGKTELVYQLVDELRGDARWSEAVPVLVTVAAGSTVARVVADLFAAVGAAPARRTPKDETSRLAQRLDARPYLVVLDDAHHLPARAASELLGYLSRHVQASRLFVVSRRELALPADARSPVITTVGPLDAPAAEQMMMALAERLEAPRIDVRALMRETHGRPLLIQRLLAPPDTDAGPLDASLDELTPAARRLARALAIAGHPPSRPMLQRTWRPGALDDALRELAERFMVHRERDRVAIDALVRDALLGAATRDELAAAHADVAEVCLGELAGAADPPAVVAVDAVRHAMAAGRHADAWHVVERWSAAIAAAASTDALLEMLDQLRKTLPRHQAAIDLLTARCLLRASRHADAAHVLARIPDAGDARACIVASDIALCAGDRPRSLELLERAAARAGDPAARFDAHVRRALVAASGGEGPLARELITAALAELPLPTARQRARAGLACAASWMLEEHYEEALVEARRAAAELAPREVDDLASQLAMLEMLAAVECGDLVGARAAAARLPHAGLLAPVAALHRAILQYAEGKARDASVVLAAAHTDLRERGDHLHAYLAGYYGSAALTEVGKLGHAQTLAQQTAQLASRTGLPALYARSLAQQAMFAAEGVQSSRAHSLATAALACPHLGARSRSVAHCARARAYTLEGDAALALDHIAYARVAVADLAAPRAAVDVERAAVELVGGNLDAAVSCGEHVVEHRGGRDYATAHAGLVLSAAYIARGRRTDLVFAERTLAETRTLADRGGLRSIQVGCAILSAALARLGNRDRAARDLLAGALRELDPERGSVYASALLAAIDGGAAARVIPGAVALLGHLGFTETVECYLVDGRARRAATEQDVTRERAIR
ncbi:MAG TPA: AAA family ATPase, partial [Kofleriaceae bacterium]|nr:AAA family ATPase [Kofleriaceae bacterium]